MNQDQSIKITMLIRDMGIPAQVKGYRYMHDAIEMMITNPEIAITRELYPEVAYKNNTSSTRTERALRHAIEISWEFADKELRKRIFRVRADMKRPNVSEYVATLADSIARGMY